MSGAISGAFFVFPHVAALMRATCCFARNDGAKSAENDSGAAARAAQLVTYLVAGEDRGITGKLISAVWDDWRHLHESPELGDLYTLRRVVPKAAAVGC